MTSFDTREFRDALGRFATGVTIVTTVDAQGRRYGVTANSYNSVSLDPPLILWSLARSSGSFAAFEGARAFAVHVLGHDQQDLATRFAARGQDKFAGLDVIAGHGGVPLLTGCAAHFECETAERFEGGDHLIFLGRVVRFEQCDSDPLIFHSGRFARVAPAIL
ncbi:flavin reductase family protein [Sphingomonas canadensis]|uniref:Flavin reductase family protein n=1 Tax=Sphingomonas canadensis TaxID=1219257 RepID=A0ABW3HGH6_9SPHN|nr:flavin reductase family protein [Sphingomonas canadensis]MCW3838337.1 flavin reductase family protein [Sphingomonas canadensis]